MSIGMLDFFTASMLSRSFEAPLWNLLCHELF
jgi:hypothetical protein